MTKQFVKDNIFLWFGIFPISKNKKYTIKNDGYHWDWIDKETNYSIGDRLDDRTFVGNELQRKFKEDGKHKDVVWVRVEYRFNDNHFQSELTDEELLVGYKKYLSVPIKRQDVNKLIEEMCHHQLSINRDVSPSICNALGGSNNFQYPFGL
tara:strand:- start:59 stop:511 length:453 start_codon:yes stop_codon:yes gene_type:complete